MRTEMMLKLTGLNNFRSAHKYDEVVTLEQNLKELRQEYWRQQQEQDES
jgi:hypothetical protein